MDVPILRGLSEQERRQTLAVAPRRRFPRGQIVFHTGDPADALLVILLGRVAVRVVTDLGDTVTLAVLGPGDSFGELALFRPHHRRTATVTTLEQTELIRLEAAQVAALRRAHPAINDLLLEVMARQVERLSAHLTEALFVPVDKRVVRRLLALARQYSEDDRSPVAIPLTQEDVAGLAGTTRPTANQVLRRLEDERLISLARGRIVVMDVAGLHHRAR